jgi:hypothetical protein
MHSGENPLCVAGPLRPCVEIPMFGLAGRSLGAPSAFATASAVAQAVAGQTRSFVAGAFGTRVDFTQPNPRREGSRQGRRNVQKRGKFQ